MLGADLLLKIPSQGRKILHFINTDHWVIASLDKTFPGCTLPRIRFKVPAGCRGPPEQACIRQHLQGSRGSGHGAGSVLAEQNRGG